MVTITPNRTPVRSHSLADDLERRRLSDRAVRMQRTLTAMLRLAEGREPVPAPLRLGIADFRRELYRVERRLQRLERGRRGLARDRSAGGVGEYPGRSR